MNFLLVLLRTLVKGSSLENTERHQRSRGRRRSKDHILLSEKPYIAGFCEGESGYMALRRGPGFLLPAAEISTDWQQGRPEDRTNGKARAMGCLPGGKARDRIPEIL